MNEVTVLPRIKPEAERKLRAAVYCRVSNKHKELEDSLENQISHYEDVVGREKRYAEYELSRIYYDFGISGFKAARPGFRRMLRDAEQGHFDMLITKSITRLARNTGIVLNTTRQLKRRGIGVIFELQDINTLSQEGELMLTLFAAFGQAESESARQMTQMSVRRKLWKGEPICRLEQLFGYSRQADDVTRPDANARYVRMMYEMVVEGYSIAEITRHMNRLGITTDRGAKFYRTTCIRILRNIEYRGDFLAMQHYVDEHRKLRANVGERPMYLFRNNHEPIVDHELWRHVQKILNQRSKEAKRWKKTSR